MKSCGKDTPRRPAYTVVRSLILAVSSLAIIGVLFAVYEYSTNVNLPVEIAAVPEPVDSPPRSTTHQATRGVSVGGGTLGPGERITIRLYEPQSNRTRFELEVAAWEPTEGPGNEFFLLKPKIRMQAPDGQRVVVTAEKGWVELIKRGADAYEAKSGRLLGDVRIDVDRLTKQERLRLDPEERDRMGEDRLIHIRFPEVLYFDLERGTVETPGAFSLRMAEAELDGVGLFVRYNDVDSRVERFEITSGGSATVQADTAMIDVSSSVAAESATPEPQAEPEVATAPATDVETTPDGIPLFQPDAPREPKLHPVQTYAINVTQDVVIAQFVDEERLWNLAADRLEVIFDFGQAQRDAARAGRPDHLDHKGAGESDDEAGDSPEPAAPQGVVRFDWTGPFVLEPVVATDAPQADALGRRLHLIATGEDVRFADSRADIACQKLEVHQESGRIWINGTDQLPVVLHTQQCAELIATGIFIDREQGLVHITGPARLADFRDETPVVADAGGQGGFALSGVDVRFEDSAELILDQHTLYRIDPVTEQIEETRIQFISKATFTGKVKMKQHADLITGDVIEMTFDPPETAGAFAQQIRTLDAQDRVVMIRGDLRLSCTALSVGFAPGPDGKTTPRFADAVENVVISQGTQTVTARNRITIEMVPIVKEKPPFDLPGARLAAMARGLEPAEVDWDRVRRDYQAKIEYTVGVETLEAHGDVSAFDPVAGMDITAEDLACTFLDGRRIDTVHVNGPDGRDAVIRSGDFSIVAHRIDADLTEQNADVVGPGMMTLTTFTGLDGSTGSTPQDVTVSWKEGMRFRGEANTAVFRGEVHATSTRRVAAAPTLLSRLRLTNPPDTVETVTYDCDQLHIDFVDTPQSQTVALHTYEQWWVFARLAERLATKPARTLPKLGKEPSHLVATHDVVGVFAGADPDTGRIRNRVRLAGAKMTVDLGKKLLTVPVSGTLLIEDYKIPQSVARAQDPRAQTFGMSGGNLPSQTYVEWAETFVYDAALSRASFVDDVLLVHRSGGKMTFAGALLAGYDFNPEDVRGIGRRTQMSCGSLVVEFAAAGDTTRPTAGGFGGLSARNLRQFEAAGSVYLEDDEFTISADRVVKYDQSDLLRIFGFDGTDAEMFSRIAGGPRFRGPEFSFDLVTGRIDAPRVQIRARR